MARGDPPDHPGGDCRGEDLSTSPIAFYVLNSAGPACRIPRSSCTRRETLAGSRPECFKLVSRTYERSCPDRESFLHFDSSVFIQSPDVCTYLHIHTRLLSDPFANFFTRLLHTRTFVLRKYEFSKFHRPQDTHAR